jgi:hypothetical protein
MSERVGALDHEVTGPVRFDYRWLQPTDTNLANLDVTIPAGFTEVPPPSKP